MKTHDITQFEQDPSLIQGVGLVVVVKWLGQNAVHDANLAALFEPTCNRPLESRYKNDYYGGLVGIVPQIGQAGLSSESFSRSVSIAQPTGADISADGRELVVASGNQIIRYDTETLTEKTRHGNDWFARLHTVELDNDSGEVLTVSSAFDTAYSINASGVAVEEVDFWRQGYNVNKFGQSFLRGSSVLESHVVIDPDIDELRAGAYPAGTKFAIQTPARYNFRGLPTAFTPNLINAVSRSGDALLASSFQGGTCLVVEDDRARIVQSGLRFPHGFARDGHTADYRVTDTGNERLLFLDENYEVSESVDFSKVESRKPTLASARWAQNVAYLGNGTYCAILQPQCKLAFLNISKNTALTVPFDTDWGVQEVLALPEDTRLN